MSREEKKKFVKKVGASDLILEFSRLAEQANAAVLASYGGTTVLVTAVMEKEDRPGDFLPLTVDYEEKFYAAGKILGSRFIRREGRPSEEAILSGRLIDRTIRPLFDQRLRRPIQVVITVLSYDEENDPDFVALMATSAALSVSDIPWRGPVAGVRLAQINGKLAVNPTLSELNGGGKVDFDLFLGGTEDKINMIELAGRQAKEADIVAAARRGLEIVKELIAFEKGIIEEIGRPKAVIDFKEPPAELIEAVRSFLADKLEAAIYVPAKQERVVNLSDLKANLKKFLLDNGWEENDLTDLNQLFEKEIDALVHRNILERDLRPDGRALDEIRPLEVEVGLLPRAHGSALFVRGNTQALAVTTLAAPGAEQSIETIEYSGKKRFLLHYNFPPYSVGEVKTIRGPGRREIGHGALAEKAIAPLLPSADDFPYTIRVVSEILSSNGSSSMATVSAASLSLMDAGVPLAAPAAGISIGLITAPDGRYKLITDIQGPEDHYGDMDFKVAGTRQGVNAIQMDVKIEGINLPILEEALARGRAARLQILDFTDKFLAQPRKELSKFAPKIVSLMIDPSRIGEVIGAGGKIINSIIERSGVSAIDIREDGRVFVTAEDSKTAQKAVEEIKAVLKQFAVGDVVEGQVVKVFDFGALVDLGGGKTGLIHISELKDGFVSDIGKVIHVGDEVKAKVIKSANGRIDLSLRKINQEKK
jgi:polyribonucleotide nucleotidyltransferase